MLKKLLSLALIVGFLIALGFINNQPRSAIAKGLPVRILISGDTLPTDIIVEDAMMLSNLSTHALERFTCDNLTVPNECGEIEEVPTVNEGYLIERQSYWSGDYQSIDKVMYYPNPTGGRGYIHYIDFIPGGNGYEDDWFYANESGEAILKRLIDQPTLQSYLISVTEEGQITVYNPDSLDILAVHEVALADGQNISHIEANHDGTQLYVETIADGVMDTYIVDLSTSEQCQLSGSDLLATSLDGQLLFTMSGSEIEVLSQETLSPTVDITVPFADITFYHSRDGQVIYGLSASEDPELVRLDLAQQSFMRLASLESSDVNFDQFFAMHNEYFGGFLVSDGVNISVWEEWNESLWNYPIIVLPDELMQEGTMLEVIGVHHGSIMLYPRDDSASDASGIYRFNLLKNENSEDDFSHQLTGVIMDDMAFADVYQFGKNLYGITQQDGNTMLYQYDLFDEDITNSLQIDDDTLWVNSVWLDSDLISDGEDIKFEEQSIVDCN